MLRKKKNKEFFGTLRAVYYKKQKQNICIKHGVVVVRGEEITLSSPSRTQVADRECERVNTHSASPHLEDYHIRRVYITRQR